MPISTIIPIYNSSKFLGRCLDSLLESQIDCLENEIILVDDGSTDDSLKICEQYATLHQNIRVFTQENQGPSTARNLGIEKATGEYITFVDSDDYVERKYFEVINKYLNAKYDLLIFGYNKITDGVVEKKILQNKSLDRSEILKQIEKTSTSMNLFWFPHTKVYKSSMLDKIRFNTNIFIGEDTIFNIEVMADSNSLHTMEECLYNYVYNEDSLTSVKYRSNLLSNMEEHYRSRIAIHKNVPEIQTNAFYRDIARYYINHILFWMINNIRNGPKSSSSVEQFRTARNSAIFEESFKSYVYDWKQLKRSTIIKLFELRQFNLLLKFVK